MRKKYRSEMSILEYMDGAFPSRACIKRAIDSMFEPNPDFHKFIKELKRRKEVRKKMAIDYREEWEKFRVYYGRRRVEAKDTTVALSDLMENWINAVINGREKLMEEFVKSRMDTEIVEGQKDGYLVEIRFKGGPMCGKILITKKEFRSWLKREKGKEEK